MGEGLSRNGIGVHISSSSKSSTSSIKYLMYQFYQVNQSYQGSSIVLGVLIVLGVPIVSIVSWVLIVSGLLIVSGISILSRMGYFCFVLWDWLDFFAWKDNDRKCIYKYFWSALATALSWNLSLGLAKCFILKLTENYPRKQEFILENQIAIQFKLQQLEVWVSRFPRSLKSRPDFIMCINCIVCINCIMFVKMFAEQESILD